MLLQALLLLGGVLPGSCFPSSDSPITEEPRLTRPSSEKCGLTLFRDAQCDSWNKVMTSSVTSTCTGPFSRIILDVLITENGTQFDRYGALWIGGVEVLRTTTAEPTAEGIVWSIEKDLTDYAALFSEEEVVATLSIPNNIDDTYTGIPAVTATISFFAVDEKNPPVIVPELLALTDSPGEWDSLSVTNGSSLTYDLEPLVYDDIVEVFLDLMASAHGCEEFWYTNVDNDTLASEVGLCGGGVYREIQVYVDDELAGATYPFPVLYTGGINPLLWRPLTGIMSFDIPAHTFDLTPFVLGDGQSHTVAVKVLGGDSQGGVWYLDATLRFYRHKGVGPVKSGVKSMFDSGAQVVVESGLSKTGYYWMTSGYHNYSISGQILYGNGSSLSTSVSGQLESGISNSLEDFYAAQVTSGALLSYSKRNIPADSETGIVESTRRYPFSIYSSYAQDDTTFEIVAQVNMSYERETVLSKLKSYSLNGVSSSETYEWCNNITSDATYNRSLDHSATYIQEDSSAAVYSVNDNAITAYIQQAQGEQGYIVSRTEEGDAENLSLGAYICGYELCMESSGAALSEPAHNKREYHYPHVASKASSSHFPFRHPLMARKKNVNFVAQ